jgi:hypothetical protein
LASRIQVSATPLTSGGGNSGDGSGRHDERRGSNSNPDSGEVGVGGASPSGVGREAAPGVDAAGAGVGAREAGTGGQGGRGGGNGGGRNKNGERL